MTTLRITPRISLPDSAGMTSEQQRVYDMVVSGQRGELVGPLRAALHNPELAERWSQLGESLRYRTRFPTRLSELAVLMTARAWNSEVEWGIHRRVALANGLEQSVVEAIRDGIAPALEDPVDREVYNFVAELLEHTNVSDAAYGPIVARWGEAGVVELTALVGYYGMVAITLNVHGIPLPEGIGADLHTTPGVPLERFILPALA